MTYRLIYDLLGDVGALYPAGPALVDDASSSPTLKRLGWMLDTLSAAGKTVILVDEQSELPETIEWLIYRGDRVGDDLVGVDRGWWDALTTWRDQRLVANGILHVDPAKSLCDDAVCYAGRGGTSYYFDANHLSVEGAALVAADVIEALRQSSLTLDVAPDAKDEPRGAPKSGG